MDLKLVFAGLSVLTSVVAVDILDIRLSQREKECYGTSMGFSFSGTHEYHYQSLRKRYTGCTHVQGNLEITNLYNGNVTYDLSFLSTIKVVTGYVLIGLLNVETVPLTSLRLIRADTTLKLGSERYALMMALTSEGTPTADKPTPGLKELQMPNLGEISHTNGVYGKVMITQNAMLCYINTIDWRAILNGDVVINENADIEHCGECHPACKDANGKGHCWGKGFNMCQKGPRIECDPICPGRCFKEGILGCCHPKCAVGCTSGLDTHCEMCKFFRNGHRCVLQCQEGTYPLAQECIDF